MNEFWDRFIVLEGLDGAARRYAVYSVPGTPRHQRP